MVGKFIKITLLLFISVIILSLMTACSGSASLPNGDYEGPGVTVPATESVSRFLPENFTVKGNKLTFSMNTAKVGSDEYTKITIQYTYKITENELILTNSSGEEYGVFTFESKDNRTIIIGGEEYIRK
jgi:hypothetical protein